MTARNGADRQATLAVEHLNHGDRSMQQGDLDAALEHFRRALFTFLQPALARPDPWQIQVAETQMRITEVLMRQGKAEAALACLADSRAICLQRLVATDETLRSSEWAATHLAKLGKTLSNVRNEPRKALERHHAALELWRKLAESHSDKAYDSEVAKTLILLGMLHEEQGNLSEALESFSEARSLRQRETQIAGPFQMEHQASMAMSHQHVGAILGRQPQHGAGLESHRSGLAILQTLTAGHQSQREDRATAPTVSPGNVGPLQHVDSLGEHHHEHFEERPNPRPSMSIVSRTERAIDPPALHRAAPQAYRAPSTRELRHSRRSG